MITGMTGVITGMTCDDTYDIMITSMTCDTGMTCDYRYDMSDYAMHQLFDSLMNSPVMNDV